MIRADGVGVKRRGGDDDDEGDEDRIGAELISRMDRELLIMRQAAGVMTVYVTILKAEGRLHMGKAMAFM